MNQREHDLGIEPAAGRRRRAGVGSRLIPPSCPDTAQLLEDPVAPHFELTSLAYESVSTESIRSLDCQSGVMAVLSQTGSLQAVDVQEDSVLLRARVRNPHRVFVDPMGSYVLATALDGEVSLYAIYEDRLLVTFSLTGPGSSSVAALAPFLRGTVHVGECVCWGSTTPVTREGSDNSLSLLIGAQKGGLVFSVKVANAKSSSHAARPSAAVTLAYQLPQFATAATTPTHIASIHFEVFPRPHSTALLMVSTPQQLYRASAPTASARTATDLLDLVAKGTVSFNIESATPTVPMSAPGSASGSLSLFRSYADSPAHSYAWSSAGGLVHGLFATTFLSKLSQAEEELFLHRDGGKGTAAGTSQPPLPRFLVEEKLTFGSHNPHDGGSSGLGRPREGRGDPPQHHGGAHGDLSLGGLPGEPQAVIPTAFHMILVYPQRLLVLNHPTGLAWRPHHGSAVDGDEDKAAAPPCTAVTPADILARVRFDPFRDLRHMDSILGVVRDMGERKLYVYGENHLWELQVENEHRQQWRLFLERALAVPSSSQSPLPMRRRLFDAAYNLCRFNDAQRSVVQFLRGQFYLAAGAVDYATSIWADCELVSGVIAHLSAPAHSRTLAGTTAAAAADQRQQHPHVLVDYLSKRFAYLARYRVAAASEEQQRVQLEELAGFAVLAVGLTPPRKAASIASESTESTAAAAASLSSLSATDVEDSLGAFLDKLVRVCETALGDGERLMLYKLLRRMLEEQGHTAAALHLDEKMGRFADVVGYALANGQSRKALEVLAKHTAGQPEMASVWYRHVRELLLTLPIATVTAMLKVCAKDAREGRVPGTLNLERMLPVFADYRVEMNEDAENLEHQVVILLEQCIHHFDCVSTPVHNLYLALLAEQGDGERLEEMVNESLFFDAHAALRVCLTHRCFSICVRLYKQLGLYEDAVITALQDGAPPPFTQQSKGGRQSQRPAVTEPWPGLVTAKELLRGLRPHMDEEVYQRMWQIVAEFAVERSRNVHIALSLVDDSDGVLQLADVIGSIDDSHIVQEFKDAICASLEHYDASIARLRSQQDDAYYTVEDVKRELADLRNQYSFVAAKQRCPLCHQRLLHSAKPILAYANCRHVVHEACAVKLLDSIGGLDAFLTDDGVTPQLVNGVGSLEELAQVDCVICGEAAIVQIDIPICEEDRSWAI